LLTFICFLILHSSPSRLLQLVLYLSVSPFLFHSVFHSLFITLPFAVSALVFHSIFCLFFSNSYHSPLLSIFCHCHSICGSFIFRFIFLSFQLSRNISVVLLVSFSRSIYVMLSSFYASVHFSAFSHVVLLSCPSFVSSSSPLITGSLSPGTSPLEQMMHPTTQTSSFRL